MHEQVPDFDTIHDAFRPRILRYLTRFVGRSEAEDLTQSVLLKVSEGLKGFRGQSELSTWIYRIATNTALDYLRGSVASHGEPHRGVDADREPVGQTGDEEIAALDATVIRGEMNACIREFVDLLPNSYRTMLVLSDIEGFTNREIADILSISVDTVKIRLHRARKRLKDDLAAGCEFYRDDRNEFACDRKPVPAHLKS